MLTLFKRFLLLFLLLLSNIVYSQFSYQKLLQEYRDSGYLSNDYNFLIYQIATEYTKDTKLENKLTLNDKIDDASLNVFVFKNDSKEAFRNLECNCGYIGYKNTIVCDEKLFLYLQKRLNFNSGNGGMVIQNISDRFAFFLSQWIIGHEIGHVILDHKIGQYYFSNSNNLTLNKGISENNSKLSYSSLESEADSFAVRLLNANSNENAFWFWLGISNMISTSYPNFLNSWWQKHDSIINKGILNIEFNSLQHPPWLVRYLDMVELLLREFPNEITDNSGYFPSIRRKFQLVQSDKKLNYPFCDYSFFNDSNKIESIQNSKDEVKLDSITKDENDYEWNYKRASDFLYTNNFKNSQKEFQKVIDKLEKKRELNEEQQELLALSYFQKGKLYLQAHLIDSANNNFKKAIKIQPLPQTYTYFAISLLSLNKNSEANTAIIQAINSDQFNDLNYLALAIYYYKINDLDDAFIALKYAKLIDGNVANKLKLQYQNLIPDNLIVLAQELDRNYNISSIEPKNQKFNLEFWEFQNALAYNFYQNSEYKKSYNLSTKIIESILQKPIKNLDDTIQLCEMYNFLGMINNAEKNKTDALKNYNISLSIKNKLNNKEAPNLDFMKGQSYFNIGNLYYNDSIYSSALEYYSKANNYYKLDSNNSLYYINEKSKLHLKLGKTLLELNSIIKGLEAHSILLKNYKVLFESRSISSDNIIQIIDWDIQKMKKLSDGRKFTSDESTSIKNYEKEVFDIITAVFKKSSSGLNVQIKAYFDKILKRG